MKIYEIVPKGFSSVVHAIKQGKYYRHWSKRTGTPCDSIWLQSEVEVLPAITEEFLPKYTEVYTSHGKWGWILEPQHRDEKGELHPAKVFILKQNGFIYGKIVPIWQDQLLKVIK